MRAFVHAMPLLMFAALAVLLFTGYPVALVLGGVGLAFAFLGYFLGAFSLIEIFNIVSRIWGATAENLVLVAIPMFIFMGATLERSGVARELLASLQVLLRRVPGALALSVTLMGTIMAATTGMIGASVVMLTLIALPVMLERGYHTPLATGTIAAAGTLGILIPPSIMLIVMGDLLQISVGELFLGAVLPGFMLSGLYLVYILLNCALRPWTAPPLPPDMGPRGLVPIVALVLRGLLPATFLIVMVLGSIFAGWATPTEASSMGALGALILTLVNRTLTFRLLHEIVRTTALTTGMIFLVIIGATVFSYVFRSLGGDDIILRFLRQSGIGPWGFLTMLMSVIFLLGFFFDWIEITLIVLPIFAPILGRLDFSPHVVGRRDVMLWFAVLAAVNLQTSFLTPPFGFALFFIKGAAPPRVRMQEIYRGVVPFVALQVTALVLVALFPRLALWLPRAVFG